MIKVMCGNKHEIGLIDDNLDTLDAKNLTHKKLLGKFQYGDLLRKCPDCHCIDIILDTNE